MNAQDTAGLVKTAELAEALASGILAYFNEVKLPVEKQAAACLAILEKAAYVPKGIKPQTSYTAEDGGRYQLPANKVEKLSLPFGSSVTPPADQRRVDREVRDMGDRFGVRPLAPGANEYAKMDHTGRHTLNRGFAARNMPGLGVGEFNNAAKWGLGGLGAGMLGGLAMTAMSSPDQNGRKRWLRNMLLSGLLAGGAAGLGRLWHNASTGPAQMPMGKQPPPAAQAAPPPAAAPVAPAAQVARGAPPAGGVAGPGASIAAVMQQPTLQARQQAASQQLLDNFSSLSEAEIAQLADIVRQ